jgi:hypothetical protein
MPTRELVPYENVIRIFLDIITLATIGTVIFLYEKHCKQRNISEGEDISWVIVRHLSIFLVSFLIITILWMILYGPVDEWQIGILFVNAFAIDQGIAGIRNQSVERKSSDEKISHNDKILQDAKTNTQTLSFFYSICFLLILVITFGSNDLVFFQNLMTTAIMIIALMYIFGLFGAVILAFTPPENVEYRQKWKRTDRSDGKRRLPDWPPKVAPTPKVGSSERYSHTRWTTITPPPRSDEPSIPTLKGRKKPIAGIAKTVAQVEPEPTAPMEKEEIAVSRGGEFIGNRMRLKIRIQNNSEFIITDIIVYLISYPDESLRLENKEQVIHFPKIKPNGLEKGIFDFLPTKDCVRGNINVGVSYVDMRGEVHTLSLKPFIIRSVCDLLLPQRITPDDFKMKLKDLDCGEVTFKVVEWTPEEMFEKALRIVDESNFFEVTSESEDDTGIVFAKIRGFAKGKYTSKNVAVEISITGPKEEKGASCTISVSGEDHAMIMPTIDDLRERLNAWLCPQCGSPLTLANVEALRKGEVVECPFCSVSIGT